MNILTLNIPVISSILIFVLLDIIKPPSEDTMKNRPLLIFIHGGGFKNNSKNGAYSSKVCNSFAKRGYVAATIDYRLGVGKNNTIKDYFEAMYRAQQDGKAAIRFLRANAKKYGYKVSLHSGMPPCDFAEFLTFPPGTFMIIVIV